MAEIIVLRGVSGAGKSHLLEQLFRTPYEGHVSVSADHYMVDEDGEYAFDPSRLSECHNKCLARFINLAQSAVGDNGPESIVVDNTNTSLWEMSPYINVALAYGHRVKVITLLCDPRVAAERNTHGTPASVILAMDTRLRESAVKMPPWWNQEVRFV